MFILTLWECWLNRNIDNLVLFFPSMGYNDLLCHREYFIWLIMGKGCPLRCKAVTGSIYCKSTVWLIINPYLFSFSKQVSIFSLSLLMRKLKLMEVKTLYWKQGSRNYISPDWKPLIHCKQQVLRVWTISGFHFKAWKV